jgi:hypothetical protein
MEWGGTIIFLSSYKDTQLFYVFKKKKIDTPFDDMWERWDAVSL